MTNKIVTYVAIQNFILTDSKNNVINVSAGDEIQFDGTCITVGDQKISNPLLKKVVGEWIVEKDKTDENMKSDTKSKAINKKDRLEHSDIAKEKGATEKEELTVEKILEMLNGDKKALSKLVDDIKDMERESSESNKKKYEPEEDNVVKKCAIVKEEKVNKEAVDKKADVVSDSASVKEYNKTEKKESKKKLPVIKDSDGKEVKKIVSNNDNKNKEIKQKDNSVIDDSSLAKKTPAVKEKKIVVSSSTSDIDKSDTKVVYTDDINGKVEVVGKIKEIEIDDPDLSELLD